MSLVGVINIYIYIYILAENNLHFEYGKKIEKERKKERNKEE